MIHKVSLMRGFGSVSLSGCLRLLFVALLVMGGLSISSRAMARDLPLTDGSNLAGIRFDDRPMSLPMHQDFQMAMLTASGDLGRSCGKMEAFGWRTGQAEQQRVNLIFSNVVDRLHSLNYVVEAQSPTSVSRDVTIFTADRADKHFLFMWSAGEVGLVMVLCETSPNLSGRTAATLSLPTPAAPHTQDVLQSKLTRLDNNLRKMPSEPFSPLGNWVGNYTCEQGYTGARLSILHLKGENFDGVFSFYPTLKNTQIPSGSYAVNGQYDPESKRILINPVKWIEHPKNYYNTVMVGSFDPEARSFSAYFQGITGCTSFEAKKSAEVTAKPIKPKKKHKKKKPVHVTKVPTAVLAPVPVQAAPVLPAVVPVMPVPATPELQAVPALVPPSSAVPEPVPAVVPPVQAAPPVVTPVPVVAPAAVPTPVVAPATPAPVAPTGTVPPQPSVPTP